MKLTLLSPERRLLEGQEVSSVSLTGSEGEIQILPGHVSMTGTLETGIFNYTPVPGEKKESGIVTTGFFEVFEEEVTVLAEILELKHEINVSRAEKAQRVAEEVLRDASLDPEKFKKYQLKLQRAVIRQQLAGQSHES